MEVRQLCLAFAIVLAFVYLPKAEALSCYKNTEKGKVAEDCGAQTGCIKKFYQKTQKVVERGCFLAPKEDKCFIEEGTGLGVCYCTTDLCNSSQQNKLSSTLVFALSILPFIYLVLK